MGYGAWIFDPKSRWCIRSTFTKRVPAMGVIARRQPAHPAYRKFHNAQWFTEAKACRQYLLILLRLSLDLTSSHPLGLLLKIFPEAQLPDTRNKDATLAESWSEK